MRHRSGGYRGSLTLRGAENKHRLLLPILISGYDNHDVEAATSQDLSQFRASSIPHIPSVGMRGISGALIF
jgi:hypothetical protein